MAGNTDFFRPNRVRWVTQQGTVWLFFALFSVCLAQETPMTTPLHQAVYEDKTDLAIKLIKSGANTNQKNRYGVSPLALACRNGNSKLVTTLLQAGADPETTLPGGESVLMIAARTGIVEPVESLLKLKANPNHKDKNGQCALMWAAAEGHQEVGEALIKAGAETDRKLDSGFSALNFAARAGHTDFVKMLHRHKVDLLQKSAQKIRFGRSMPRGTTALRLAVENGHYETAVYLLKQGADPDERTSGNTPILHVLTWVRKPHRGDSINGMPPPEGSGKLSSLQFARIIIEHYNADVNRLLKSGSSGGPGYGTKGASPLLLAIRRADLAYCKLLHELGADLSATNADGTNALSTLAGVGSRTPEEEAGTEKEALAVLDWLLPLCDVDSQINVVNKIGETAMHGAAYRNWPTMAKRLDQLGADPSIWNQKNKRNWTPLLIAQGYRPGNFKPSADTIETLLEIMKSHKITIPTPPKPR